MHASSKPTGKSSEKSAIPCAVLLRALGDESRLSVLRQLMSDEKCVQELNREIQIEQSLLSHHLKILKDSGLVESSRMGKTVRYRLSREAALGIAQNEIDLGCCSVHFKETPKRRKKQ